jgi:uncharacterized protein
MERWTWTALTALAAVVSSICLAGTPVFACDECKSAKSIAIGETQVVGNGVAYSWVKLDGAGKPLALGVTLTESAPTGLSDPAPGMKEMPEYTLALPKEAAATPFDHVGLNWNPKGHDPTGIYDVPHFDFHFYTLSREERRQITGIGPDLAKCDRQPPAGYLPAGYILAPGSQVPRMGTHWVDPASPEFHGEQFTRTFIYGTYDGRIAFLEPMVTKAFLETHPDETRSIKLPTAFSKGGYYPTSYTVKYDPARREYIVALGAMRARPVSGEIDSR